MKRPLLLSLIIISFDQILKWYFQTNFHDKKILLFDDFGFTYVVNPGIYISMNISEISILLLQLFVVSIWIVVFYSLKQFQPILRKRNFLIDLSFAFLTTGLVGNLLLDRIMFGYIRDYLILPMGIANLADFCGLISLFLFSFELYRSKEFRDNLLRGKNAASIIPEIE